MTDSTGVFLYSRVMTFADCTKMKVPVNELSLCTTVPPDKRPIAQAYIWTTQSPLDRFPPSKFSPVPNQLAENFAIRAIEAQPLDYARAVFDDTWRVFGWKRAIFPNAPTYDEYIFGYRSLPIPAWDQASSGRTAPTPPRTCTATRSPRWSRRSPTSSGATSGTCGCRAPCTG